jgi:hypothetical protein
MRIRIGILAQRLNLDYRLDVLDVSILKVDA